MVGDDGNAIEMTLVSRGICSFEMDGEVCDGRLYDDARRLVWSDGAVWTRKEQSKPEQLAEPRSRGAFTIDR